jgi:N-ethylmaleimide reductase
MSIHDQLFTSRRVGRLEVPNRAVMAPMTRSRAGADGVPTPSTATYYAQRASAGLIITEGVHPTRDAHGAPGCPGIYTDEQEVGWRAVAQAVHARGGRIFAQLWHCGRIADPRAVTPGLRPVAPSPVAARTPLPTPDGPIACPVPRTLTTAEVGSLVDAHADAAVRAVRAGLDGVELHAANGFLLHQFLSANANLRADRYGGDVSGRIRMLLETAAAVAEAIGPDRVGIRVSPGGGRYNDIEEPDARDLYPALIEGLAPLGLAYVHVVEAPAAAGFSAVDLVRPHWPATLIANAGPDRRWDATDAATMIEAGRADLVAWGRLFLATPDLVERFRIGALPNVPDPNTFYTPGDRGYVDYPTLERLQDDPSRM